MWPEEMVLTVWRGPENIEELSKEALDELKKQELQIPPVKENDPQ